MRVTARLVAVAVTLLALGACTTSVVPPSASVSAVLLTHITLGPFAFDAPRDWTITPTGNPSHYFEIFGFVAAPPATATETCGPDYIPGGGACDDTVTLPRALW